MALTHRTVAATYLADLVGSVRVVQRHRARTEVEVQRVDAASGQTQSRGALDRQLSVERVQVGTQLANLSDQLVQLGVVVAVQPRQLRLVLPSLPAQLVAVSGLDATLASNENDDEGDQYTYDAQLGRRLNEVSYQGIHRRTSARQSGRHDGVSHQFGDDDD